MTVRMKRVLLLIWRMLYPLLLYQLISELVFHTWLSTHGGIAESMALPLTALAAGLSLVPLGILYRVRSGREHACQTARTGLTVFWSALAGIGACLLFNYVVLLLPFVTRRYEEAQALLFQPSLPLQILCTGLVIPLTEELIFRGLAYRCLRREFPFAGAAVISAIYFGLFHGNLLQGTYAFILGLLLAWLYEKVGRLSAVWAFHAAANVTAVVCSASALPVQNGNSPAGLAAVIGGVLMAAACYQILQNKERGTKR
ncbi:MAG: type II CAAX endopeptidase family protein [Lachnospiraceae bacterium]|nr:type II CAAX endopeptidase family protein [Lachnospiraceae bacterium]